MTSTIRIVLLAGTVAGLPLAAQATGQEPPATPAAYWSAFDGYRPFEAGEVQDWRKSNDTVREIGGWRAYAREIQQGAGPIAAPDRDGKAAAGKSGASHAHPGPAK